MARDLDAAARVAGSRIRFDRYVLDLGRGSLYRDDTEIALRPKTYAVLYCLAANAGRLVTKDALFAAVWPDLAITDDVLVQSIGELRHALGDEGTRLIKTIPRRGYRLEAALSSADPNRGGEDGALEPHIVGDPRRASEAAVKSAAPLGLAGHERDAAPVPASEPAQPPWFAGLAEIATRLLARAWTIALLVALALALLIAASVALRDRGGIWNVSPAATRPVIAVLPLLNQTDDPSREYFADGVTQDIIGALGRFSGIQVMSWSAVQRYKGNPASPSEVAGRLGVDYQVEGSVRWTAERIRVTARLVDKDGGVIWSGQFDDALADIFALQDRLTNQVAGVLAVRVSQVELRGALAKPTAKLEVYDLALRARPALRRPTRAGNVEARGLLKRAIDLDPGYAAAYAGLAETYLIDVSWGWAQSPAIALGDAAEMAGAALRLNDNEVQALIVLGRVHLFHHRYEQAMAELDRAVAINPSDAQSHAGRGNVLMWLGDSDAALDAFAAAQRIDPDLNAADRFALSMAYYLTGRYEAAAEQAEINLSNSDGAMSSRVILAASLAQRGQTEEAARVVSHIRRVDPTFDPLVFGDKLRNPRDLAQIRDGLRKAGFTTAGGGASRDN